MTRPGFIVPNANLVAPDIQASQPDQGDFLVLGNGQYGVIAGCKPVLSFPTVTLATDTLLSTAHILVCAGEPFLLQGAASVNLAGQGQLGRWDLIVFDSQHGGFKGVTGTPANNPVFPDITDTMVVLAAVSVPSSGSGATPTLVDKRNFLSTSVVADSTESSIVRTYDTTTPVPSVRVNVTGQGKVTWGADTKLENTSPGVLTVSDELRAKVLTATQSLTSNGFEVITESTIQWGTALPGSADTGDIFVNITTGDVSVWRGDVWSTIDSSGSTPVGAVIMAFSGSNMGGWLPLLGQTLPVTAAGGLPTVQPGWVSGSFITLPDMRGRMPVGGGMAGAGLVNGMNPFGSMVDGHGTLAIQLGIDNLPSHVHQEGNDETALAGSHSHTGTVTSAGAHQHNIVGWGPFFGMAAGSQISNLITGGTDGQSYGTSNYTLTAGEHSHLITGLTVDPGHTHTTPIHNAVGGGVPVMVSPPTLTFYFYIKI